MEVTVPLDHMDILVPLGHFGSVVILGGIDIVSPLDFWLIGAPLGCVLVMVKGSDLTL